MAKTPYVDKDECISCNMCVTNVPDVFRMDENDKAECYNPTGSTEEDIQMNAIDVCPVSCIHWEE